ncbi:uncharacterized protein LOC108112603 [Drosophila eugracilis]|uniref:uncharacterized protein LOC108112603 n=1 Tax=Drosophila eugracilis TaxID=29029 RepID=UPI0007E7A1B6|nr:uncharacterized protein LOC108112603 [Drosophila eugracilis]
MKTLQLSIRSAHCAMKKMQRGRRIRESNRNGERETAIGNANPPSTFQLKSSKFICN